MRTRLYVKIKTMGITNISSIPTNTENKFMEIHKLDYNKRRLEEKIANMNFDIEIMNGQLDIIAKDMKDLLKETNKSVVKNNEPSTSRKGGSKKLKY